MFEYYKTGFKYINNNNIDYSLNWIDILEINVYKKDLITQDLIIMEIVMRDQVLTINEEIPGWFQLVVKLKEVFESIPKNWDFEITKPAFEEIYTNIYRKSITK